MFKSTPDATRTPRTQAERIGTAPAGFNGLPDGITAAKLGWAEPTEVAYDFTHGHPITSELPEQQPVSEPRMRPAGNEEPAVRVPFELGTRR